MIHKKALILLEDLGIKDSYLKLKLLDISVTKR